MKQILLVFVMAVTLVPVHWAESKEVKVWEVKTFAQLPNWKMGSGAVYGIVSAGPNGIAVDASGNIYVAEAGSNLIQKISPEGDISTLAGQVGVAGSTDGIGTTALFYHPRGIALDSNGNVYIADSDNNLIRKITPNGLVSTLAGSTANAVTEESPRSGLIGGFKDGTGTDALFNDPRGIAVDSFGNVYVADMENSVIRKITPDGVVTTFAGQAGIKDFSNGIRSKALFNLPTGITVDHTGNIYVADDGNQLIRKITPKGMVTTLAGTAGTVGSIDGTGKYDYPKGVALFNNPYAVAVDSSGNVYVADENNCTIRKITSRGRVSTIAGGSKSGTSADGIGLSAKFGHPLGIAVDSSGNVYVSDIGSADPFGAGGGDLIRKIQYQ